MYKVCVRDVDYYYDWELCTRYTTFSINVLYIGHTVGIQSRRHLFWARLKLFVRQDVSYTTVISVLKVVLLHFVQKSSQKIFRSQFLQSAVGHVRLPYCCLDKKHYLVVYTLVGARTRKRYDNDIIRLKIILRSTCIQWTINNVVVELSEKLGVGPPLGIHTLCAHAHACCVLRHLTIRGRKIVFNVWAEMSSSESHPDSAPVTTWRKFVADWSPGKCVLSESTSIWINIHDAETPGSTTYISGAGLLAAAVLF